jgi:hypothetical protein
LITRDTDTTDDNLSLDRIAWIFTEFLLIGNALFVLSFFGSSAHVFCDRHLSAAIFGWQCVLQRWRFVALGIFHTRHFLLLCDCLRK